MQLMCYSVPANEVTEFPAHRLLACSVLFSCLFLVHYHISQRVTTTSKWNGLKTAEGMCVVAHVLVRVHLRLCVSALYKTRTRSYKQRSIVVKNSTAYLNFLSVH